eukprot:gene5536-6221_t
MKMNNNKYILSLAILSSLFFCVNTLCFPEHPQAAVCRASYVIKATVISTDWEVDLARKATTKAATTQAATTQAATTEAATTQAATTKAATTKAATTKAAITEAATTKAAITEAASTKAATTEAATTEAATTKAAITEAATTKAAITKAVTSKPIKATTKAKEGKRTTSKNKIKESEENIFEPAMIGAGAYLFRLKIIRLKLHKLYKGLNAVDAKIGDQMNITFSSPHKPHMKVGKTYLITGFSHGKELKMNDCNWHEEWDKLTDVQKLGLRRYYWLYCPCKVRFCPSRSCGNNPRMCQWVVPISEIGEHKADLLSSYSVCMVKCGSCGWYNPKEYVDCTTRF